MPGKASKTGRVQGSTGGHGIVEHVVRSWGTGGRGRTCEGIWRMSVRLVRQGWGTAGQRVGSFRDRLWGFKRRRKPTFEKIEKGLREASSNGMDLLRKRRKEYSRRRWP